MTRGAAAMTTLVDGFLSRMRKSPLEYSNSSRLCSPMKRRSCSICSISGFANEPLGFEGFLRFMPLSKLDEIPRSAGQYFGSVCVHGDVVFNANPTDAFHIYTRFDGDHVSRLEALFLPPRQPGIFMHDQPKSMARAMHEVFVQTVARQDFSRRGIHFPTGHAARYRGNRCGLGLQHRFVPPPDAFSRPSNKICPGNVAAIVAEYSTQVEDDKLIFPQSLGGWTSMRECSALPEGDNGFQRRAVSSALAHLVFDLRGNLEFAHAGFQQIGGLHDNIARQDSRLSHLRDL